ncbi:MAG: hydrogenase formation protein HypD [Candidatus Omnitrophica bacterium]|nr:hydrogenase formation protein HypD [Candidatus Omnitrophota bacterium]
MKVKAVTLMEVCGTHTMAIARSGIKKLLPDSVRLISGPGCPVCVTAQKDIDLAIAIAKEKDVIMATFGDMIRVPGTKESLYSIKAQGKDVRVVYSCLDALQIALANPEKKVVFMGVGFETTSPTVALTLIEAKRRRADNFFVLSNFKLIFPALAALAGSRKIEIDGFICPGHVSVITGSIPYEKIAKNYKVPCVITGFDDNDILQGIKLLIGQINSGEQKVEIAYKRAVKRSGNTKARNILKAVFRPADSEWRGLGIIKKSGLALRKEFRCFDAEREFKVNLPKPRKPKGCICGEVLQGISSPVDCRLFKKACTPQSPIGPCMVSSEGTCAAYYKYGA